MPSKNKGFSVLYSPSISPSSSVSKSKSRSRSKSKRKSKSKSRSKRKSLINSENKPPMGTQHKSSVKQFAFRDITNIRRNTVNTRTNGRMSWRKNKVEQQSLKKTRDNLSKLLYEKKWKNKIQPSDIITIQYNPVKEIHIHLYNTSNQQMGYHVKATFPLNRWSLLLQYNPGARDYDFIVKNEMQTVVMREHWENKNETIKRLTGFKTILLTKEDASTLLDNMLDITTIIEEVIKTNVSGGAKRRTKTKRRKHKKIRLIKTVKKHRK